MPKMPISYLAFHIQDSLQAQKLKNCRLSPFHLDSQN